MSSKNAATAGIVLLRVVNGGFLLAHGVLKLVYYPPKGTMGFFESWGLPGETAWLLIAAEVVFGALLLIGAKTRFAAPGAMVILLGAVIPHAGNGFVFSNPGGGWEYPLFWALMLLALSLLEAGRERDLKEACE